MLYKLLTEVRPPEAAEESASIKKKSKRRIKADKAKGKIVIVRRRMSRV